MRSSALPKRSARRVSDQQSGRAGKRAGRTGDESSRVDRWTDAAARAAKPGRDRRVIWGPSGLGLRITPSGRRTWVFLYRRSGRARWQTLGRYPRVGVAEVHRRHAAALAHLAGGTDPADLALGASQDGAELSVAFLVELYLERYAKVRKRSWAEDQRLLRKDVLPRFGGRRAGGLRRRDVIAMLDEIVARKAPVTANRVLAVLRRVYNWAIGRELVASSPCLQVARPWREQSRERYLSLPELEALVRALHGQVEGCQFSPSERLALLFMLATGQRPGEVAGARWMEMDVVSGWWTIPAERTKNRHVHAVPLSTFARETLGGALLADGPQFVFFRGDSSKRMPSDALGRAMARNRKALGLVDVHPHDLRRTVATQLAAAGTPRVIVARVMNHADKSITQVYDRHVYAEEMRVALETWGRKLAALAAEEEER